MKRLSSLLLALFLVVSLSVPAFAGVTLTVKPGGWCDVVRHPDGFAWVRQDGATVIAEVNGIERWRVTLPEPTLYLRAAAAPNGAILALGQSQSGRALVTIDGAPAQDAGEAFGQNGLLAWHDGTRFVVWIQRSPDAATRLEVGGGEQLVPLPWTSQGFRDVSADGVPLLGDQWFQRTIRGRSIHEPVVRGNLWAGQWSDQDGIGVLADDQEIAFTAIAGLGFEPHLARAGDRLAIAARTPDGAALAIITPPYPPTEPIGPVDPPHDDPPKDDPVDPGKDDPAECGGFAPSERAVLVAIGAKYPELRRGDDDQRRAFTLHLAQQLAFSVSREWGTKRADPGRPPSKDAVARVIAGRLCSWDVINGTTREMVLDAQGEDITGQVYIAVDPVDVLGGRPIDPPEDLGALKAHIAELEHQLAEAQDLHAQDADQIAALTKTRDWLRKQLAEAQAALEAATTTVYGCEVKLPSWAKSLGLKVGCTVVARPRQ